MSSAHFRRMNTLIPLGPSQLGRISADLKEGFNAIQKGDYATALQKFKPLAEQGDLQAQFNLGWIYANSTSAIQDDAEAVLWYC